MKKDYARDLHANNIRTCSDYCANINDSFLMNTLKIKNKEVWNRFIRMKVELNLKSRKPVNTTTTTLSSYDASKSK